MKYTLVQMQYGEVKASEVYELRGQPHAGESILVNVKLNKVTSQIPYKVTTVIHTMNDTIIYIEDALGNLVGQ